MFFFGSSEQTARTIIESVANQCPAIEDKPIGDMSEEELRNSLVMHRMGLREGSRIDAGTEVVQILARWHDERLEALMEVSEKFKERVQSGKYKRPKEYLEKRDADVESGSES